MVTEGRCLQTLSRNALSDLAKMHVLPGDQKDILISLDEAIREQKSPAGFKPYLYLFCFGERDSKRVQLDFDSSLVLDQTIHVACTLNGVQGIGFLRSRQGVQQLIGARGTLSTCLSFRKATKFQSNLDGRMVDVHPALLNLEAEDFSIQFLQMYGDTPHLKPKTNLHPVSAVINGGLFHATKREKAVSYMGTCKDNLYNLRSLSCRIEYVVAPKKFLSNKDARNLLSLSRLGDLLNDRELIVPFHMDSDVLCSPLREIGTFLTRKLQECYKDGKSTGSYSLTWGAYQCELAMEKFLWGRPLSTRDHQGSIRLGPEILPTSNSKTDTLGFLALESVIPARLADPPPPLSTWTKSVRVAEEMANLYGFSDLIISNPTDLGLTFLKILMSDLFHHANLLPSSITDLRCQAVPSWGLCTGFINLSNITGLITRTQGVRARLGTRRALEMLDKAGKSAKKPLEEALKYSAFKFFPAVRSYVYNRNPCLNWNGFHLWRIQLSPATPEVDDAYCQSCTQVINQKLVSGGFIHQSKLKDMQKRPNFSFPWMKPILQKLRNLELSAVSRDSTLLFCSCVALMKQGWYLPYPELLKLELSLPVPQHRLKDLDALASTYQCLIGTKKIFRLHHTITVKLEMAKAPHTARDQRRERMEEPSDDLFDESVLHGRMFEVADTGEENVTFQAIAHHPASIRIRWTGPELEIRYELKNSMPTEISEGVLHDEYLSLCRVRGNPSRPLHAFRRKFKRQ